MTGLTQLTFHMPVCGLHSQGREIRSGGNLVYVDSPAVNTVKHGRILILEGIKKAERDIMPVLNNLLENCEMWVLRVSPLS
jgi:predicted ribosome-associated RNA-binding protein Tma20